MPHTAAKIGETHSDTSLKEILAGTMHGHPVEYPRPEMELNLNLPTPLNVVQGTNRALSSLVPPNQCTGHAVGPSWHSE